LLVTLGLRFECFVSDIDESDTEHVSSLAETEHMCKASVTHPLEDGDKARAVSPSIQNSPLCRDRQLSHFTLLCLQTTFGIRIASSYRFVHLYKRPGQKRKDLLSNHGSPSSPTIIIIVGGGQFSEVSVTPLNSPLPNSITSVKRARQNSLSDVAPVAILSMGANSLLNSGFLRVSFCYNFVSRS
jgi:hypothetical protein